VRLLVDTCVVIWLATGERPIPDHVASAIATGEVSISAATAWEIALKYARGILPLVEPPERFVARVRKRYILASLSIDEESTLNVRKLPLRHRDPFDRILVSQAIVHGLTIVTPDPLIAQYPVRTLW